MKAILFVLAAGIVVSTVVEFRERWRRLQTCGNRRAVGR